MEKRDHKPQVHGEQVIKVQCKVDISPQVPFLPCVSSILISYLALLGNLLHEECMVTMVSQLFASGGQSIGVFSFIISPSSEHPGLISFRNKQIKILEP